jgi:hypothetical protein
MVERELKGSESLGKAQRAFSDEEITFGSKHDLNEGSRKGLFSSGTDDVDSAEEFYAAEMAEDETSSEPSDSPLSSTSSDLEKAQRDHDAVQAKLNDAAAVAQMSAAAAQQLQQEEVDKRMALEAAKELVDEGKALRDLSVEELNAASVIAATFEEQLSKPKELFDVTWGSFSPAFGETGLDGVWARVPHSLVRCQRQLAHSYLVSPPRYLARDFVSPCYLVTLFPLVTLLDFPVLNPTGLLKLDIGMCNMRGPFRLMTSAAKRWKAARGEFITDVKELAKQENRVPPTNLSSALELICRSLNKLLTSHGVGGPECSHTVRQLRSNLAN